jgi:hypothetical protein
MLAVWGELLLRRRVGGGRKIVSPRLLGGGPRGCGGYSVEESGFRLPFLLPELTGSNDGGGRRGELFLS